MKRKKLSEIISKEDRQEFLQYLMEKELEKIRKKIYKYKRCDVNWFPITIEEAIFESFATIGLYAWDEKNQIHKIYIASRLVNRYLSLKYKRYSMKKYAKESLIDTIGHELTHALVKEKFEHIFSNIKGKYRDGSPIFLATLQYLGYSSGHHCGNNYIGSKVWKDIDELKKNNATWNNFRSYIFLYLKEIDDIRERFNNAHQSFQPSKEYQFLGQSIEFRFSSRGSGLHKVTQSITKSLAYIKNKRQFKRINVTNTKFGIGSMMYPQLIEKLIPKKLNNDIRADISLVSCDKLIMDDETKYNKWLYKKEEMYNKNEEQKVA